MHHTVATASPAHGLEASRGPWAFFIKCTAAAVPIRPHPVGSAQPSHSLGHQIPTSRNMGTTTTTTTPTTPTTPPPPTTTTTTPPTTTGTVHVRFTLRTPSAFLLQETLACLARKNKDALRCHALQGLGQGRFIGTSSKVGPSVR